ncbi:hypothetical protein HK097_001933 [Rhizophlyctis rosea]|uniref:Uncharacterized protein n=1 Tax=Rhizophlyctis rosea TaxID=64517 RepID=A0AAD5SRG5_9FUNG|nr:hypothetical protein HK097_001933 [Rhizophlyctis rosea]
MQDSLPKTTPTTPIGDSPFTPVPISNLHRNQICQHCGSTLTLQSTSEILRAATKHKWDVESEGLKAALWATGRELLHLKSARNRRNLAVVPADNHAEPSAKPEAATATMQTTQDAGHAQSVRSGWDSTAHAMSAAAIYSESFSDAEAIMAVIWAAGEQLRALQMELRGPTARDGGSIAGIVEQPKEPAQPCSSAPHADSANEQTVEVAAEETDQDDDTTPVDNLPEPTDYPPDLTSRSSRSSWADVCREVLENATLPRARRSLTAFLETVAAATSSPINEAELIAGLNVDGEAEDDMNMSDAGSDGMDISSPSSEYFSVDGAGGELDLRLRALGTDGDSDTLISNDDVTAIRLPYDQSGKRNYEGGMDVIVDAEVPVPYVEGHANLRHLTPELPEPSHTHAIHEVDQTPGAISEDSPPALPTPPTRTSSLRHIDPDLPAASEPIAQLQKTKSVRTQRLRAASDVTWRPSWDKTIHSSSTLASSTTASVSADPENFASRLRPLYRHPSLRRSGSTLSLRSLGSQLGLGSGSYRPPMPYDFAPPPQWNEVTAADEVQDWPGKRYGRSGGMFNKTSGDVADLFPGLLKRRGKGRGKGRVSTNEERVRDLSEVLGFGEEEVATRRAGLDRSRHVRFSTGGESSFRTGSLASNEEVGKGFNIASRLRNIRSMPDMVKRGFRGKEQKDGSRRRNSSLGVEVSALSVIREQGSTEDLTNPINNIPEPPRLPPPPTSVGAVLAVRSGTAVDIIIGD